MMPKVIYYKTDPLKSFELYIMNKFDLIKKDSLYTLKKT